MYENPTETNMSNRSIRDGSQQMHSGIGGNADFMTSGTVDDLSDETTASMVGSSGDSLSSADSEDESESYSIESERDVDLGQEDSLEGSTSSFAPHWNALDSLLVVNLPSRPARVVISSDPKDALTESLQLKNAASSYDSSDRAPSSLARWNSTGDLMQLPSRPVRQCSNDFDAEPVGSADRDGSNLARWNSSGDIMQLPSRPVRQCSNDFDAEPVSSNSNGSAYIGDERPKAARWDSEKRLPMIARPERRSSIVRSSGEGTKKGSRPEEKSHVPACWSSNEQGQGFIRVDSVNMAAKEESENQEDTMLARW
jgi:hypothetical protein